MAAITLVDRLGIPVIFTENGAPVDVVSSGGIPAVEVEKFGVAVKRVNQPEQSFSEEFSNEFE